ncbi:hypothetical protein ILYODFUR_029570 [Ilyodon furcidens]|uniref:Uncharacterized protein n=1 Tax=Ilyodon furcidens TaxID=33524 RepID=A0ABV0TC33_9TELE
MVLKSEDGVAKGGSLQLKRKQGGDEMDRREKMSSRVFLPHRHLKKRLSSFSCRQALFPLPSAVMKRLEWQSDWTDGP